MKSTHRRRSISVTSFAFFMLVVGTSAQAQKIAVVDIDKIYYSYHLTKEIEAEMKLGEARIREEEDRQNEVLNRINTERISAVKKLQALVGVDPKNRDSRHEKKFSLAKEALRKKSVELSEVSQDYKRYRDVQQTRHKKVYRDKLLSALKIVRDSLQAEAEAEGYDFLIDKTGKNTSQVPLLIYGKGAEDKTEVWLGKLNQKAIPQEEKAGVSSEGE